MVTGLDLVELQLRVAAGEPLPLGQDEVRLEGHAVEARVYAEDAFGGFLPQAGTASVVRWPAGSGVRVDQALESGQVVSTAYDPMLGKVIAHGRDREQARRRLVEALDGTVVLGLTTNAGFLRALVASEEFRSAAIDTAWLDRHDVPAPDPAPARVAAAWATLRAEGVRQGPWAGDGFRLGAPAAEPLVELDEPVRLTGPAPQVADDPVVTEAHVELVHHGQRFVFPRPDPFADPVADVGDGSVLAPMPGTVLDVRVREGEAVEAGQVLGTLEAMKMELALKAGLSGTVATVGAAVGDQVALGAVLFEVVTGDE